VSAIDYAKEDARVDEQRIYAVGWSGGDHLELLLAGRAPEIWAESRLGCRFGFKRVG
jgi:predicted peptidase